MTLFVSVRDIPNFYIHCGLEVKKLMEMLTQGPILKPFQPILQEGKRVGRKVSAQKKKTSNISLFLLAFIMDFHSMFQCANWPKNVHDCTLMCYVHKQCLKKYIHFLPTALNSPTIGPG